MFKSIRNIALATLVASVATPVLAQQVSESNIRIQTQNEHNMTSEEFFYDTVGEIFLHPLITPRTKRDVVRYVIEIEQTQYEACAGQSTCAATVYGKGEESLRYNFGNYLR